MRAPAGGPIGHDRRSMAMSLGVGRPTDGWPPTDAERRSSQLLLHNKPPQNLVSENNNYFIEFTILWVRWVFELLWASSGDFCQTGSVVRGLLGLADRGAFGCIW